MFEGAPTFAVGTMPLGLFERSIMNIAEPIASVPSGSSLESPSTSLSTKRRFWPRYADGVCGTGSEESDDGELEVGDGGCVEPADAYTAVGECGMGGILYMRLRIFMRSA